MSNGADNKTKGENRVERILVRPGTPCHRPIGRVCQIVRRLKNQSIYLYRHAEELLGKKMSYSDIDKHLKTAKPELYRKLPSAIAQRTTQICQEEQNSYFKALKAYRRNPSGFSDKPRQPGYAHKAATTYIGRNGFKVVNGSLHFPKALGLPPIRTSLEINQDYNAKADLTIVREVRLVPAGNCYFVEVIYDVSSLAGRDKEASALNPEGALGVDLGIDNLAALVSNQPGFRPVLINGKTMKSINALYNKDCAQLRSKGKQAHLPAKSLKRRNRLYDAMHKASRLVVDICVENQLGVIVIGKNDGWKQKIKLGKRNNQKFAHIPHSMLIGMITYKAESLGISVIIREESYTSKASALDLDAIPDYGKCKTPPTFSGKRVKRGLYQSKTGLINADVNGALNILRKELGDGGFHRLTDGGCVYQPVRVDAGQTRLGVHSTRRIATDALSAASCVPKPIPITQ